LAATACPQRLGAFGVAGITKPDASADRYNKERSHEAYLPSLAHSASMLWLVSTAPDVSPWLLIIQGRKSSRWRRPGSLAATFVVLVSWSVMPLPQTTQQAAAQPMVAERPPLPGGPKDGPLQLNSAKNYGNKYANGVLPVGDSKYSTTKPQIGNIYACSSYASSLIPSQGGSQIRGPWFINNNTEYIPAKKVTVSGSVQWTGSITNVVSGSTRTITTNDLPSHKTGTFPILRTDPAYRYDQNGNSIAAQSLVYSLTANPSYGAEQCMTNAVGVMLTGVEIFSAFDAGGRDAGAWEMQDGCNGHPQQAHQYHYHTLSSCISDTSVQTVIGFALDGFPITGPKVSNGNILTTTDLDDCHGISSTVLLDGKSTTTYH
jgi:hypothetical protein